MVRKKKYLTWVYDMYGRKIHHLGSQFDITRDHCSTSLGKPEVMPISDPCDRFFCPHHTPMKETYILTKKKKLSFGNKFCSFRIVLVRGDLDTLEGECCLLERSA